MAAPRKPQDAATIAASLAALLDALAGAPPGSPAAGAFVSALRRRGEELAAVGGVEALHEARTAALATSPSHAAVLDGAWATIPGWTA
ncbi:hypothetical protein [Methylobacterium ajmalii]|jgi:hypothetical protein|uniref:hypothetical protein n=1 Tax=Methylobacterium ajmalii TaxID=2738439 RepID=UPI0019094C29|nr:hypothetical protein [Methylobacterium ajmalii]MBK3400825.1 hypothetical protein [Methylobacterium ajmalii]MBK3412267.1 hypothetical protein [Methylobacterium ajmalii]MBK3426892.1 hypothetical protein [Methylobacterium ajmalii]MBZ6416923.1 hypothetical protein [Methylobacterium sp.]